MTDRPDESAPRAPEPARKLPSAREQARGGGGARPEHGRGRGGGPRRGTRRERPRKSPPARSAAEGAVATPVEPDLAEARLEVGRDAWTARVLGRATASAGTAPLLLVGFWPAGGDDGPPEREALVVGRSLAELSPARLLEAHAVARAPRAPGTSGPQGFFADAGDRKRR